MRLKNSINVAIGYIQTLIIVSFFAYVVYYFYMGDKVGAFGSVVLSVIVFSFLADGIFLLLHLPRRQVKHHNKPSFDPSKLTVVIACYNGEDISVTQLSKRWYMCQPTK